MKRTVWLVLLLLLLACPAAAREGFHEIHAVPVPGKIVVDGDLEDWDLSGAIETFCDESLLPSFSVKLALMYDVDALYLAARFVDNTPMVNVHDPQIEPDKGWAGDCLQVRLSSDPAEKYPLVADTFANKGNDRICHLTMWYFTPRSEPVLDVRYSMAYHGAKLLTGANSGLAFRQNADGKGYLLEGRISWELLNAKERPPKAGDSLAFTVQPLWGSADGRQHRITFNEIVRQSGFAFQNAQSWGRLVLSKSGNIPPAERPLSETKRRNPLALKLNLPDARAKVISAMLFDAAGKSVRTLPATVREDEDRKAALELAWDGLDDRGRALPPGNYTVKLLTHRGTGQKFVCSLHNSGNPPWKTDDGTGAWGGDWDDPLAAAFDGERVYLGWGFCEGGSTEIAVDQKLTPDGNIRKFWGAGLGGTDVLRGLTALAVNDDYVFLARDGAFRERIPETIRAGVTIVSRKDGSPANFPFGDQASSRWLILSEYPSKMIPPERPLFELRKTNAFGPSHQDLNLIAIAVSGDLVYGSLVHENKIVAFNWKTGQKMGELAVRRPAGLQVRPDGKLVAAAGNDLLEVDRGLKQSRMLARGVLEAPYGLALDKAGSIYVADQGAAMQVKVFSPDGKPLRTVGKKGGRPWIGKYDPQGMLMPRGIAVDGEGKLWVTEKDNSPRRVSVWSADGKLVADFHGPSCPQNDRRADLEHPELVNVANVLYKVDYQTGKAQCVSTPWRPFVYGWTPAYGYRLASCYSFQSYKGQRFAWLRGPDGMHMLFRFDGYELKPIASYGYGHGVPLREPGSAGLAKDPREILPDEFAKFCFFDQNIQGQLMEMKRPMHRWVDRNGDGLLQGEELTVWVPGWEPGAPRFVAQFVDENLTIWARWQEAIFRVPVESWTKDGVPVYPDVPTVKPLFLTRDRNIYDMTVDTEAKRIYAFYQENGDITKRGDYAAMVCYDYEGNVLWEYSLAWPCFALDAPFWKPGYLVGTGVFIGSVKLESGIKLLMTNGYYGDYPLVPACKGIWGQYFAALDGVLYFGGRGEKLTEGPMPSWGALFALPMKPDGTIRYVCGLDGVRGPDTMALCPVPVGKELLLGRQLPDDGKTGAGVFFLNPLTKESRPLKIFPGRPDQPGVPPVAIRSIALDPARKAIYVGGYFGKFNVGRLHSPRVYEFPQLDFEGKEIWRRDTLYFGTAVDPRGWLCFAAGATWLTAWHGHIARLDRTFSPAPGIVASWNFELNTPKQVLGVRDVGAPCIEAPASDARASGYDPLVIATARPLVYFARWNRHENRLELVRRIGSLPSVSSINISPDGWVSVGVGPCDHSWWRWDDGCDAPPRFANLAVGASGGAFDERGRLCCLAPSPYAKTWTTGVFSPITATHSADVHPDNLVPFEPGGFGLRQGTKLFGAGVNAREVKVATAYATNRDDKGLWSCPIDVHSWKAAGRDQWKKIPTVGASLADPGEIAMLEDSVIALADAGGVTFLREAAGRLEFIARLDKCGDAPDQSFGKEIHIAAAGPHLVIADTQRHRVLWFHAESRQFKGRLGNTDAPGASLGVLDRPKCLGIHGNHLAVYDAGNQRIVKAVLRE